VHAAAEGSVVAQRALLRLARGVTQDVLPGVRLEAELPALAAALTAALADSGDGDAAAELAAAAAAEGRPEDALRWTLAALAALTAGGQAELDTDRHAGLLEGLAHARAETGDAAGAKTAYAHAAAVAMAAGRGKLAARLAALAEGE
jgi:hypothetical protein